MDAPEQFMQACTPVLKPCRAGMEKKEQNKVPCSVNVHKRQIKDPTLKCFLSVTVPVFAVVGLEEP